MAVVQDGGFTAAARRLHLTQQAVSAHVARLEALVGGVLLIRTTRTLRLTPEGEALFDDALRALRRLDRVVAQARQRSSTSPTRYTLGFSPSLSQAVVPALIAAAPASVQLRVHQRWADDMVVDLTNDTLDAGLALAPARHPGVDVRKVGTTQLAMSVRATTVPPGQRVLPLADLVDLAVVMPDEASNPGLHETLQAAWQTMGRTMSVEPVPRLLGPSILEIARHDVCSPWPMVMPLDYVPAGVVTLPIEPEIHLDIAVMARDITSEATDFVVDSMSRVLQSMSRRGVMNVAAR